VLVLRLGIVLQLDLSVSPEARYCIAIGAGCYVLKHIISNSVISVIVYVISVLLFFPHDCLCLSVLTAY
jgi:hypothetical protein